MSSVGNATDAIPSAPRGTENLNGRNNLGSEKAHPNDYEDKYSTTDESDEGSPSSSRTSFKSSSKKKKANGFPASVTICHISNSTGCQIGNNVIIDKNFDQVNSDDEAIEENDKIIALKCSSAPVNNRDIRLIAGHIGNGWKNTFKKLGFTKGEIQQKQKDHEKQNDEHRELILKLLMDWIHSNPENAKVGILARVLWATKEREAVKLWSEQYEALHK